MRSGNGRGWLVNGGIVLLTLAVCCAAFLPACGARSRSAGRPVAETAPLDPSAPHYQLIKTLDDRNANIRLKAVKTLAGIGPEAQDALPRLLEVASNDAHPNVRGEAVTALVRISPDHGSVVGLAIAAISDPNARVRKIAIVDLERAGYTNMQFLAALQKQSQVEPDRRLRKVVANSYAKLMKKAAVTGKLAESKDPAAKGLVVATGTPQDKKQEELLKPTIEFTFPKARAENREAVAVIIGNKAYEEREKNVPDVKFAHNDADAVYKFVIESLGFREGNVMLLKDASQADLVATFGTRDDPRGRLSDWVKPGKSDVFVFYSGHGAPSLADGSSFLLPVDADPMKVELTGYKLETFYANLGKLNAKRVMVVIDACFSGSFSEGTVVKNASSISLRVVDPKQLTKATVLTASDVSEVASWDDKARYGLFTRHFLEGVSGKADSGEHGNKDGKIELSELKAYLESEVTYNARRQYGRDQHPRISGEQKEVIAVVK